MSALTAFAIIAIGSYVLWQKLTVVGNPWIEIFVPIGVCAAFSLLVFWVVNHPKIADFMIAAEGEIKKVSWSSRKEITASTTVVVITVISLALLLLAADVFFIWILKNVLNVY